MQRVPPCDELVNVLEFEEAAKLTLPASVYSTIAGGDRTALERILFRPRVMVSTLDLDLTAELFGEKHFTPIIVGPVADQRQYHTDGELATVRGAAAAKAAVVISSRSSVSIGELVAQAKTPLWYSVYADAADGRSRVQQAVAAGCRAVCITTAAMPGSQPDWNAIDRIRRGVDIPVVIKGIMTGEDAKKALELGAGGVVISDHGAVVRGKSAPIEILPSIVDLMGGKIAVLVDGGFRRGTDILKALVLGARAVLVARPVMWGLAAYGAGGVQKVIEMLQNEVARNMGSLGAPNLASLNRSMVRMHGR